MRKLLLSLVAIILFSLAIQAQNYPLYSLETVKDTVSNWGQEYFQTEENQDSPETIEEFPSSPEQDFSNEFVAGGYKLYFENPRTGYQSEIILCSSGRYQRNVMTSYGLDEENGNWSVQQSGGTNYLVLQWSDDSESFPIYSSNRAGYLYLGQREYSISSYGC